MTDRTHDNPFDRYAVVVNDEQQYSLWPTTKALPTGWTPTGFEGHRQECVSHIDEVWTDMRPRSVRERVED